MRRPGYFVGGVLTLGGLWVAIPAFLDWMGMIFSASNARASAGFPMEAKPIFIRFLVGGFISAVGQVLLVAVHFRLRAAKSTSYQIHGPGVVQHGVNAPGMQISQTQISLQNADFERLSRELEQLRHAMAASAQTADQHAAVGQIAMAERAAQAKDGSRIGEYLGTAGRWALDIATQISVPLATTLLKRALGLT